MMNKNNIIAGLGGAIVLTILNETLKNVSPKMPRINLVGEEAVQQTAALVGINMENEDAIMGTALMGDIVSNTAYYSLINGEGNDLWLKAAASGFTAGLGAVNLPEKLGLNDEPVAQSMTTKVWTVAYYMIGALATASILKFMDKSYKIS